MKKVMFRGKLFFRHLFSYLALVLIPLIIIGIFYSASFSRAFSAEVFSNVDKDMDNISTQIDSQLYIFGSIVRQVSLSPQLSNMPNHFDPESINELKKVLTNYTSTNPFVQDIYVTLPELGYVVSSTTSSQLSYFSKSLFQMQGVSPQELEVFFCSTGPAILPSATVHQAGYGQLSQSILFRYPIYTDYLKIIGTVVFQVPVSKIETLLSDKLQRYNAQTVILDAQMQPIFSALSEEMTPLQLADTFAQDTAQTSKLLDKEYMIRRHTSQRSGLHYITLIPQHQTFTQISRLNWLFLLAILVVVAISGFAIAYALRLNYFPLLRLHDKAGRMVNTEGGSLDALSDIEDALEQLSGQNIYLTTKLEDSAMSIKISRLQKLLTNGYASVDDFNLDCQELNMQFNGTNLFVTTSCIHTSHEDLDEVGVLMKGCLSEWWESCYIYALETNKLVMIHCLPDDTEPMLRQQLIDVFNELHRGLFDSVGLLITTGIGPIVNGTTDVSRSYLDSSSALDYRFIKGKGQVIDFHEINIGGNSIVYPQQHFNKLQNALHIGNEGSINQCIDEIIEIIEKNNYPLTMARSICFNLINIATNTPTDESAIRTFLKPNLFVLSEMETIQDLVKILKCWRSDLYKLITTPANASEAVSIDKVVDYLNLNCLRCNFSIYETAEHFGMALPKFSQFFKDQTNQNVLDYTIKLRMDEAARLLVASEEEIKEIALKTGYYNTSSFIRRFKQIHGVTPGDYRKFIRKNSKEIKNNGKPSL